MSAIKRLAGMARSCKWLIQKLGAIHESPVFASKTQDSIITQHVRCKSPQGVNA